MKGKKGTALILAAAMFFGIASGGLVTEADADTSVTESMESETQPAEETTQPPPVGETEAAETTEETAPEQTETAATDPSVDSTVPDSVEIPDDTYPDDPQPEAPEDDSVIILPEIMAEQKFPSVFFSNPAPMGSPVRGLQSKIRSSSASEDTAGDNLILNKTVTDNGDETFTLTLESYATGTASIVTKVPVPTDVVLVLDESGSMNDCIECGHEMDVDCNSFDGDCLHKVFRAGLDVKKQYKTFYHESSVLHDTIVVSAGKIGYQIELSPDELIKLTRGTTSDLTV